MLMVDNQSIGKQSFLNASTVIMEKKIEQTKASEESAISEKQNSKSKLNDVAVIYEKNSSNKLKIATYANPSIAKGTSLSKSTIKDVQKKLNSVGYSCGTPDGVVGKNTDRKSVV